MAKISIDNIEYDADNLSDQVKQQLQMVQIADQEIIRLNAQLAMIQTARAAYVNALKQGLSVSTEGLTTES